MKRGNFTVQIITYGIITLIWLFAGLAELFVLSAGLLSDGHDRGRLIPLAIAVVIIPVIAYGCHALVRWLSLKKS